MAFSVSRMTVDSGDKVVALNWTYTTSDGSVGGEWLLNKPYGEEALSGVTKEKAAQWLEAQLPNTAEELSQQIIAEKDQAAYAAGFSTYIPNETSAPTKEE